ncbi:hypothetical protein JCM31826_05150 [Thermaurantimonas aggregans]|uniref:Signal transduction histidine kinase internal region domain-containing protein n=2 Tax=Schleiferiaceae TaxID=1333713 RepID=A0A401XJ56_9FLAO|nr:hypothetical protein JCM31826_05150 [Thermaurantimonas aggregans]
MQIRCCLILLTTFFYIHSKAQVTELPLIFQSFGIENGLYNPLINDVVILNGTDRYFATEGNGLVHFQQGRFYYYGLPEGLRYPFISTLCVVNDDSILVGSENEMYFFSTKSNTFHLLYSFPSKSKVRKILSNARGIYVLTNDDKLWIFEKSEKVQLINEIKLTSPAKITKWNQRIIVAKDDTCLYQVKDNILEAFYVDTLKILNIGSLSDALYIFSDVSIIKIKKTIKTIIRTKKKLNFVKNLVKNDQYLLCRIDEDKLLSLDASNRVKYISIPAETNKFSLLDNGELWISEGNRVKCYLYPSVERVFEFSKDRISKVYDLKIINHQLFISAGTSIILVDLSSNEVREIPFNTKNGLVLQILKDKKDILFNTENGLIPFYKRNAMPYPSLQGKYIGSASEYPAGCLSYISHSAISLHCEKEERKIDLDRTILSHHWTDTHRIWIQTDNTLEFYSFKNSELSLIRTFKISPNALIFNGDKSRKIWLLDDGTIKVFKDTIQTTFYSTSIRIDNILKVRNLGEDTLIILGDKIQMAYIENNKINLITLNYFNWINGVNQILDFFEYQSEIYAISTNSILKISNKIFSNYSNPKILLFRTMVNGNDRNLSENIFLNSNENTLHFYFSTPSDIFTEKEYRYRYILTSNRFKNDTIDSSLPELYLANIYPANYTLIYELISPENTVVDRNVIHFTIASPLWQRWWVVTGTLVFLISGSVAFVKWRTNQLREKVRLKETLLETETRALRLQMNPHFLYNSLESIEGFILKSDKVSAIRHLNNFTRLMRLILEGSDKGFHSLKREKEILYYYLDLERMRANNEFDYQIHIFPENVEIDQLLIPSMIIQPHVENAIIHGIRPLKDRKGLIKIIFTINENNNELEVLIDDNGVGRSKSSEFSVKNDVKSKSMALNINAQRLKILSQTHNKTFLISIEDLFDDFGVPSGTRVRMTLPILKNTEVC